MYTITDKTIGEAWLKAVSLLLNNSEVVPDDKGLIREVLSLIVHIQTPSVPDKILEQYANKKIIFEMKRNFRNQTAVSNWNYSYAQRLYNFKGVNQIEKMIETLRVNRLSKSATVSLFDITNDQIHKPCLAALDFKIRNDVLVITGFFRSQDVGKKLYADALELLHIGQIIADQLSISSIEIIHFISSAHLYEEDRPEILKIIQKAMACR